jgi:hypothetical protein
MCDYSLGGIPNRLAVEGEELIAHRFVTGSMGLASEADLRPPEPVAQTVCSKSFWQIVKSVFEGRPRCHEPAAVCIPPGARLIVKNIPIDLQKKWNVEEEEGVVFTQIGANAYSYRDAVQFRNGRQVLLQNLREGMRMQVLSMSGAEDRLDFSADEIEFRSEAHVIRRT